MRQRVRVIPSRLAVCALAMTGCGGVTEHLTAHQVLEGLNAIRPDIQACAHGRPGQARIDFTLVSDGTVRSASVVDGVLDGLPIIGSPAERCLVEAARSARFHPFQRATFVVSFPFVLGSQSRWIEYSGPPTPPPDTR